MADRELFSDPIDPAELAMTLLERALTIAVEDGTYDHLSSEVRSILSKIVLPPPGGVSAVINGALDDAKWAEALLAAEADNLRDLEAAADLIPKHKPLIKYNRSGSPLRQHSHDVAAVRAIVERRFMSTSGSRLDNLINRLDDEGRYTDADICALARASEASHAETAREMDRRGEVIERLEDQIADLTLDRDQWRDRESETQEALQALGESFGIYAGEPRVDGIGRVLRESAAEITRLRAENAGMREALEEVAEPIAAIQKRAKELGAIVDGGTAVHLSSDAGYLKGIARAALSKASQAEGQTR